MIVLGTGYHRNKCAIDLKNKCKLNDINIIKALPDYANSGLLTTFGINNFHLLARGLKEWVKTDRSIDFQTWWKNNIKPSKNLPLIFYQIRYLITDSYIGKINVKKTLLTTDNVLIIIFIIFIIIKTKLF